MKKNLILTFLFSLFSTQSFAIATKCGEYSFNGVVRNQKEGTRLIINEKSMSQYTIDFNDSDTMKLSIYNDQYVSGTIKIETLVNHYNLSDATLLKISERVPNPLNPTDTFLTFVKADKCK